MSGKQRRPTSTSTPTEAEQLWGGASDTAALVGAFTGGDYSGLINGVAGTGKEAAGGDNIFGAAGGMSNALSAIHGIGGDDAMSSVYGGMGSGFGTICGVMDAMDESKSTSDRVVGGIDAGANALNLGAQIGGVGSIFEAGTGVAGASTLASSSAGTALTAGGATSLAAGGAVLGAGVAGYKVGQGINAAANSEYAQQDPGSVGGTHQTYSDWWLDQGVEMGGATGMAVGVTGATLGSFADATVAGFNYLFGD